MSMADEKATMRRLGTEAQEVVKDATLTAAQKTERLDKIEADLKKASDMVAVYEKAARLAGAGDVAPEEGASVDDAPAVKSAPAGGFKSFGEQIVGSKHYDADRTMWRAASGREKRFELNGVIGKAAQTVTEGSTLTGYGLNGEAGALVTPQFMPGILPLLYQPLLIADLFAQGTTDSAILTYAVEAAWNDNAGPTAEGALKNQSDGSFARRTEQVGKITNMFKMSDEMYADAPAAASYLTNRLTWSIQRAEEHQLLNGTGEPGVTGLLQRSGLLAPVAVTGASTTPANIVDGIFQQMTALRTQSFVEPDAFVINPVDWETIRLAKDKNGQYYSGGPFTGAYGNPGPSNQTEVFGLRGVVTTAVPQGTVIVGGFQQCGQIFRKEGISVVMTNSNVDDFQNDLISVRAEERLALAVYRPQGFGTVTISAS